MLLSINFYMSILLINLRIPIFADLSLAGTVVFQIKIDSSINDHSPIERYLKYDWET